MITRGGGGGGFFVFYSRKDKIYMKIRYHLNIVQCFYPNKTLPFNFNDCNYVFVLNQMRDGNIQACVICVLMCITCLK